MLNLNVQGEHVFSIVEHVQGEYMQGEYMQGEYVQGEHVQVLVNMCKVII